MNARPGASAEEPPEPAPEGRLQEGKEPPDASLRPPPPAGAPPPSTAATGEPSPAPPFLLCRRQPPARVTAWPREDDEGVASRLRSHGLHGPCSHVGHAGLARLGPSSLSFYFVFFLPPPGKASWAGPLLQTAQPSIFPPPFKI
jgi:hypothetical protein